MLFSHEVRVTDERGEKIRHFAKDPAVIRLKDTYYLYFSAADGNEPGVLQVGIAESRDMEHWTFCRLLPREGDCEQKGIGAPCAFLQGETVHLFFQTYGNGRKDAICHAWSSDGVHFTHDPTNPIFAPTGDFCCGRAIDADVAAFGDKLFLYFATRDPAFVKQKVGVAAAPLSSDFGRDAWTQCKYTPCLSPLLPWEKDCIEAPAALVREGKVYLFYGGAYNCEPQQIGVAVSDNGVDFTRLSALPFLSNGAPGSWNESESGHPYVFEDTDGQVYLFYQGSRDKGKNWYLSRCRLAFRAGKPFVAEQSPV